ncbi:MAG: NrfD/PsrC family molybdoenzyme membrane anchor subunit [Candidatus Promineifilaceae bacterium]
MLKVAPQDKEKLIDPLFRTRPSFWLAVFVLLAVIAWGVYHYARQLTLGLGETGMDRPVYWGLYMVNFIFFIGISQAGTLISAILRLTGAEWRRPITRVAEAITAVALTIGALQIIIDMGRPDRLLFVIQHGRLQSPILWDVLSVTAYLLGSVAYLYLPMIPDLALVRDNMPEDAAVWQRLLYRTLAAGWRGNREQWRRLEKAVSIMAIIIIPIAISLHTITSWILATTVQPGWHSSIFGPYFVVAAIFSGIGALFLAMTTIRWAFGLQSYITQKQYFNLGLLFIVMAVVWGYFTYSEEIGVAAGQQSDEFPVLASKLWGEFALSFWAMIALILVAFLILVIPLLLPKRTTQLALFQPRFALVSTGAAALMAFWLYRPEIIFTDVAAVDPIWRSAALTLLVIFAGVAVLAVLAWLKARPLVGIIIASCCVIVGVWLERWNIVVPTMTHPRLIEYTAYRPSITEIALTAASVALFMLLFLVFFKLFPAISIWEIAEGRVISEAQARIEIPAPAPSETLRRLGRWGQRE